MQVAFDNTQLVRGHIIKVKVKYQGQGYISPKMAIFGGISVSQTHLVLIAKKPL